MNGGGNRGAMRIVVEFEYTYSGGVIRQYEDFFGERCEKYTVELTAEEAKFIAETISDTVNIGVIMQRQWEAAKAAGEPGQE